jgi:hypothetical protein
MKTIPVFLSIAIIITSIVACQKETITENKPPVVDAGKDTTVQLLSAQNDTVALAGSAIDPDGQVVATHWSQISGTNTAKILFPGSPTTKVSGVIDGEYIFQLLATDNKGATGVKTVIIGVKAPQMHTLVIQPTNNPSEMYAYSYDPTNIGVGNIEIPIGSWTVNGTPVHYRPYIKLDYTIPANANIISAKLSLFAMPSPLGGNTVDAHYGSANAFYVRRITAAWTPAATNWNSQPSTTTANQVTVPNSTASSQDAINIDVTQLVKDMQQNGNHGFAMRLITENYYNIRQYVSSYNSDATKRPKLVIQYTN